MTRGVTGRLKAGRGGRRGVVKTADVLGGVEAEAGAPYEATALARRAARARPRLALLALAGAAILLASTLVTGALAAAIAGAAALVLLAWGVRQGKLAALVGVAFAALLTLGLAIADLSTARPGGARLGLDLVALALAAGALPDVVLLVRDAELQHAYGRWARRG